jgi:hypothetical protein
LFIRDSQGTIEARKSGEKKGKDNILAAAVYGSAREFLTENSKSLGRTLEPGAYHAILCLGRAPNGKKRFSLSEFTRREYTHNFEIVDDRDEKTKAVLRIDGYIKPIVIANHIEDIDSDGILCGNEIIGAKTRFRTDEKIIFMGTLAPYEEEAKKGTVRKIVIYGPNGSRYETEKVQEFDGGCVIHNTWESAQGILDYFKVGSGNFKAAFYANNSLKATQDFEILGK